MPKDTTASTSREANQTTLNSFLRPTSSTSSASSSSSTQSHSRGRGRGARGRGRGRGSSSSSSSQNDAERQRRRDVAAENQSTHIPALMAAFPDLESAIKGGSVVYRSMPPTTTAKSIGKGKESEATRFAFRNLDSFDAAREVLDDGEFSSDEVAVLNMANAQTPGGGFLSGAMAQEEALCRRSTLYAHLTPSFYPLHEDGGGIWSPSIRVFRKGDDDKNEVLTTKQHFQVGVISLAALRNPMVTQDGGYASPQELQTIVHKIIAILRIAKLHNQKALILGAFGCGAFRNPPKAMAALFLRLLTTDPEFIDAFREVRFAILERSGSQNMRPWLEVWEGVLLSQPERQTQSQTQIGEGRDGGEGEKGEKYEDGGRR